MWRVDPQLRMPSSDLLARREGAPPLVVQLAPKTPAAPPRTEALRPPREPPPRSQRRLAPPVVAHKPVAPRSEYRAPADAPLPQPAPSRQEPPIDGDLAAYVEARRRARAQASSPPEPSAELSREAEDENARANRIAAANLASGRSRAPADDTNRGGGIFGIQYMSHEYAEFLFYGWNRNFGRNTTQLVEVRKGTHSDIRIAVVRSMIAIIREHERGDFVWESRRLARNVTLSARPRDERGLEDFLMREFFAETR